MSRTVAERRLPSRARRNVVAGVTALASTCLLPRWSGAAEPGGTPFDMATLLKRVQVSSAQRNFSGVYVVSAGGSMSSARLVHYCNGSDQIDKIEGLDGQMRRVYRHNDLVHVLWPQSQEASIEPRELVGRLPGPAAAVARRPGFAASAASAVSSAAATDTGTGDVYEASLTREDRVAGYEAQVITLKPRDAYRYPQRWWVERETGLLLRNDLLGPKGEVLESAGFSELQIGVKPHRRQLLQEMHNLQGYRVLQPQFTRTTLEQEGWTLRRALPGFRLHACVRRTPPRPHGAAPDTTPSDPSSTMLQAIYTDGLMHVSLFIEAYDGARHNGDNPAVFGATRVNSRRDGDWWITAVGEVPALTLQAFLQGLERLKP